MYRETVNLSCVWTALPVQRPARHALIADRRCGVMYPLWRLWHLHVADLTRQLSRMSMTALFDAYYAAWTRCKMDPQGKPPRARFVQELVTTWRVMRKMG